ncbi:MAG TPA: hypothetical protein VFU59_00855, partial [Candidatus Eisenbacteria bacterium]|nr:hypothetical protein [Candidatus Eisenbacteria bacterium]
MDDGRIVPTTKEPITEQPIDVSTNTRLPTGAVTGGEGPTRGDAPAGPTGEAPAVVQASDPITPYDEPPATIYAPEPVYPSLAL